LLHVDDLLVLILCWALYDRPDEARNIFSPFRLLVLFITGLVLFSLHSACGLIHAHGCRLGLFFSFVMFLFFASSLLVRREMDDDDRTNAYREQKKCIRSLL